MGLPNPHRYDIECKMGGGIPDPKWYA